MMKSVFSAALWGLDAFAVKIEVDSSLGLPGFSMVGLPDSAVRESRERVVSSIRNNGYEVLNRKITINMAPADRKKEGSAFDLAIAVGLLLASEQICDFNTDNVLIVGELGLDGKVVPIKGALSIAIFAKQSGFKRMIVPIANSAEISCLKGIDIFGVNHLRQCIDLVQGKCNANEYLIKYDIKDNVLFEESDLDFSDVKGQAGIKRALELSASGGHNFLMVGSPGSGKSMCAKRLPTILPSMTMDERLECTRISSSSGNHVKGQGLVYNRPFRAPHHTLSSIALVGGGIYPKPGEVSLSHLGVLFLDELPEFKRSSLEVLRQPLEDGYVSLTRANFSVTYPARFILGAAMNPCPCGYYMDPIKNCTCTDYEIKRYRSKISGPLLDRIDLHIEVPALDFSDLNSNEISESSQEIRERVEQSRNIQSKRYKDFKNIYCNAHANTKILEKYCYLDSISKTLMKTAMEKMALSARGYTRVLKVARTLADMETTDEVKEMHLLEALQYRTSESFMPIR